MLAENDFDDNVLSSPAVSEGQIFIRTTGHLYAIGERREPPVPASNIAAGVAGTADESVAVLDAAGGREPAGEDGGSTARARGAGRAGNGRHPRRGSRRRGRSGRAGALAPAMERAARVRRGRRDSAGRRPVPAGWK